MYANCFYFASPGLGEMVLQTPIMREMHSRGIRVYLIIRENYAPAFVDLPFIEEVIGLPECEYVFMPGCQVVHLSDKSSLRLQSMAKDGDFVMSSCKVCCLLHLTHYGPQNKYENTNIKDYDFVRAYAYQIGVQVSDLTTQIGFRKSPIDLHGDKKRVGIIIGSEDKYRRMHPELVEKICDELSVNYSVYLFGKFGKQYANCQAVSLMECDLQECLNYMHAMDAFVATDSGFMHCALAMGKKIAIIEGRELAEQAVGEQYYDQTDYIQVNNLTCDRKCRARFFAGRFPPSFQRLKSSLPCSPWKYGGDWDNYPENLMCGQNQKVSVECLTNVPVDQVVSSINRICSI